MTKLHELILAAKKLTDTTDWWEFYEAHQALADQIIDVVDNGPAHLEISLDEARAVWPNFDY